MYRFGIDRRQFLRGASCALALPFLPSIADAPTRAGSARPVPAKRLVCVGALLGFHPPAFFANGASPRLLRPLDEAGLGSDFTTISGLDHKGPVGNGHVFAHTLFTGTIGAGISLDQHVAPALGRSTRYESLQLCAGESKARPSLSFTARGAPMPAILDPAVLYARIFGVSALSHEQQLYLIDSGRSLLDGLVAEAKALRRRMDTADADTFEEYLASLRDVERDLAQQREWIDRPYPAPPADLPAPANPRVDGTMLLVNEDLMWDLMALALKNDSTRVISFSIPVTVRALLLDGALMSAGYHTITHHGNDPETVEALLRIEERHMRGAARFLKALKDTPDPDGGTLLDSTVTMIGSAIGDAATHVRTNYPLLVAGGGFAHRRHLACEEASGGHEMACDLYVSVLQRLGFEDDRFATSTSDLNEHLT
ncbi:MAG TPA: DUF1552 domain-containing protein [Planctomycetota bacterium]|nr:DUF1552 domain-containing protein [Planctomycetota bacterium]